MADTEPILNYAMRDEFEHPYAVRGKSPRQIMEAIRCALGDAEREHKDADHRVKDVLIISDALAALAQEGVAFCDILHVKR